MMQKIASDSVAAASTDDQRMENDGPRTSVPLDGDRDPVPLVVDLDGTLLKTDSLHEGLLRIAKRNPLTLFSLMVTLLRGRAAFKQKVAELAELNRASLPLRMDLVAWLEDEKACGRKLALATAANQQFAAEFVAGLNLFDVVIGSGADRNLKGTEKLEGIRERCGETFDYAGNSGADLEVWRHCRRAIVVGAGREVERRAKDIANVARTFPGSKLSFGVLGRVLRLYQWSKNVLIFVPAFTSHKIFEAQVLVECLIAFVAFSLVASATYVANDLLDLEEDRQSSVKRFRAIASGECSIRAGVMLCASCLILGFGIAAFSGIRLIAMLVLYAGITLAYSVRVKRFMVLDVLTLALLYTLRIVVGHAVTGIAFSMWLLSFSFFLFLSLALCKRAAELVRLRKEGGDAAPGRAYVVDDLHVISTTGMASGFLSCLVFALYINSANVVLLYRHPGFLWGILPLLVFYLLRIWLVCGRGELDTDPIIYTAESRSTYYIAAIVFLFAVLATARF